MLDEEALMRHAIGAARRGMAAGGGPFGALVVDGGGRVLAARTNVTVPLADPTAHAEVSAIRAACAAARTWSLRGATLVATCAPCVMCAGAIHWAGIARVVAGARAADAEAIGFVEAPGGFDAAAFFAAAGIAYRGDVEREAVVALLRDYRGPVYNG